MYMLEPIMRTTILAIAVLVSISVIPISNAGTAEKMEDIGFTFGGLTIDANISGNASSQLSDLPAIVEYYTATWCSNCVYVEHALDDIEANGTNIQQFHFHRDQDSEDPWGTTEGEARWNDRYDGGIAPTVVFNGSMKQIGSVPESDSLDTDYINLAAIDLQLGNGSSTLGWATTGNNTGMLAWNIVHQSEFIPEGGELVHMLWVTERYAYFPEGSNGVENYPHVVKSLITLGNQSSGTMEITLPEAHDGTDLQIHLIHQLILPDIVEEEPPAKTPTEEDSLPSIALVSVIAVSMIAAITVQRRLQ